MKLHASYWGAIDFRLPLTDPVLVFSLVLFIILLAPLLLRKLRIPSIIGLIIAGVVIGRYGLNLMEGDLLQKGSSINLFGTVGLLYIMFLAGLELDLNEFRKNRHRSLLFGILTFSFPFVIGIAVCHYLLHFDYTASVLVSSMFSTHTLVAYPIASRLGINKNQAVTIAVGGTIITDTVVLLILAVITGSGKEGPDNMFWIKLGVSLILFVALVFIFFPIIGRLFFKNIKGDSASEFIFVLAMVFLAGFLAEMAGIEPIIGAFMAGLALNRLIPHTSPIMNRIEFVGNALFIPFFLIGVGMLVDLRILLKGPEALLVAGTLTIVAFTGKYIAAFIAQKIFRQSLLQRNVLFGLTSAHAAATLAVILTGFKLNIVDENVLNGTVILILITCLVSSFVTENAGRKLAIIESKELPQAEDGLEKMLVPISNPDTIGNLLDFAIMLKDTRQKHPIFALSVVKDDDEAAEKVLLSNKMLEQAIKHAAATDSTVQVITRVDLNVVSGIARAVKETLATDLIMGWSTRIHTAERLFGTKLGGLTAAVWENIYACNFVHPINTIKKIVVVAPKNAEYELGFGSWINKLKVLSQEAGADVLLCCSEKTRDAFHREMEKNKPVINATFRRFDNMEDFLVLSEEVNSNNLLIVISARRGTISYNTYLDSIPGRLNRHFKQSGFVLLYPKQQMPLGMETGIPNEELSLYPLQGQLENLNKIGKRVKRIFRNDESRKKNKGTD